MIDLTDRKNIFYWQTDRKLSPEDYKRIFLGRHDLPTDVIRDVLTHAVTTLERTGSITILPPDESILKGNVNIVRKVLINGTTYVVRMHPPGLKNGYFFAEQQALARAASAGVPVPHVLEVHEARTKQDMDFMLTTASPGVTMDVWLQQDKTNEDQLLFDCGKLMAAIHTVRVQGYGAFDNVIAKRQKQLHGLHPTYDRFIHVGLDENLTRLITYDVITRRQADEMARVFTRHAFEPPDGPRLIHNDFADWNLLTDGERITAVLD
ncbi:phosphotransferase [Candidatus Gottesmanbacteria bacterium]|nr:phosphotransferase [Candidatus Gottesmanbacteria bacterium]